MKFNSLQKYSLLCVSILLLWACSDGPKKKTSAGSTFSEMSIYHLPAVWETHEGTSIALSDLKGKILVITMIYTSCQAACPRLVADMKAIKKALDPPDWSRTRFIFVSIDPQTDTPEQLYKFAAQNDLLDAPWLFLRGYVAQTRTFSNILAVKYKQISPIDFSHSNIISVFNSQGVLTHQKEGLSIDQKGTVEALNKLLRP